MMSKKWPGDEQGEGSGVEMGRPAEEALAGVSNVGDCTHFRRNNGRDGIVIGNHVFY